MIDQLTSAAALHPFIFWFSTVVLLLILFLGAGGADD